MTRHSIKTSGYVEYLKAQPKPGCGDKAKTEAQRKRAITKFMTVKLLESQEIMSKVPCSAQDGGPYSTECPPLCKEVGVMVIKWYLFLHTSCGSP